MRVLNRMLEWTESEIRYAPDQRHGEIICKDMGLGDNSKGVVTPGVKEPWEEDVELGPQESSKSRALVARANYLAQDRMDIQFATKELCREMAKPTERAWRGLKRLARYLKEHPRMVQAYRRQRQGAGIVTTTDTDFAGCSRTRKSTSGGIMTFGKHVLKRGALHRR